LMRREGLWNEKELRREGLWNEKEVRHGGAQGLSLCFGKKADGKVESDGPGG